MIVCRRSAYVLQQHTRMTRVKSDGRQAKERRRKNCSMTYETGNWLILLQLLNYATILGHDNCSGECCRLQSADTYRTPSSWSRQHSTPVYYMENIGWTMDLLRNYSNKLDSCAAFACNITIHINLSLHIVHIMHALHTPHAMGFCHFAFANYIVLLPSDEPISSLCTHDCSTNLHTS